MPEALKAFSFIPRLVIELTLFEVLQVVCVTMTQLCIYCQQVFLHHIDIEIRNIQIQKSDELSYRSDLHG